MTGRQLEPGTPVTVAAERTDGRPAPVAGTVADGHQTRHSAEWVNVTTAHGTITVQRDKLEPAPRFVVVELTDPAATVADAVALIDDLLTDGFTVAGYAYPAAELEPAQLAALRAELEPAAGR